LNIGLVTLFPEIFSALNYGITGRALQKKIIELTILNPRDFTLDIHRTVDDRPYGGGPGMVMKVESLLAAINATKDVVGNDARVIYLSPQGKTINQALIKKIATYDKIIFISGRYEGIDERVIQLCVNEEWSIGDYVLSGGEFAALVLIDAITRLLPEALGDSESAQQDSFCDGLLEYPHFTRPEEFAGLAVPKVLLSGDHAAISRWRLKESLGRTWLRRPELLQLRSLNDFEQELLNEFIREYQQRVN
jgi:tRNA (guanine37-N1)-methyltransferase